MDKRPPTPFDIEVGSCLIDVKRDLSAGSVLPDAMAQLGDYQGRWKENGDVLRKLLQLANFEGQPPALLGAGWRDVAISSRAAAPRLATQSRCTSTLVFSITGYTRSRA
jgi:hypothetical protein